MHVEVIFKSALPGEVDVRFLGEEEDEEEGTPTSAAMWRSRFLMDYDPLNQLLVCMVCGELQHSHTLEGVRAHIEEAHPNTASLGPREHRHIQEAWDEQVSVRERFFSSQMQQQGAAIVGESFTPLMCFLYVGKLPLGLPDLLKNNLFSF